MATQNHSVQLSRDIFEQLELEAGKRRMGTCELADELVRAGLAESTTRSCASLRDALDVLDAVSARMPDIDAARILPDEQQQLAAHAD